MAALRPMFLLLLSTAALLSGCAGTSALDSPTASPGDPASGDGGDAPRRTSSDPVAYGQQATLLEAGREFMTPMPEALLTSEVEVGTLHLDAAAKDVAFNFTRTLTGSSVFADNCRVYEGTRVLEQDAFSDAQVGSVNTTGTCDLVFGHLGAGDYRIVMFVDPSPRNHDVRVVVTGALAVA